MFVAGEVRAVGRRGLDVVHEVCDLEPLLLHLGERTRVTVGARSYGIHQRALQHTAGVAKRVELGVSAETIDGRHPSSFIETG